VVAPAASDAAPELILAQRVIDRAWGLPEGAPPPAPVPGLISEGRALALSAAIPGAGQLYAGEASGLLFALAEVAGWTTHWLFDRDARRQPVSFAFELTEPAQVDFRILDTSGHEVASFSRSGLQADNLVTWDPGRLPAGLYLAQLRFRGSRGDRRETMQVGVLR
jgi:hypothetical protein